MSTDITKRACIWFFQPLQRIAEFRGDGDFFRLIDGSLGGLGNVSLFKDSVWGLSIGRKEESR